VRLSVLEIKNESLYAIVKNPNLLFGITNLITPVQDKAILYLPFSKDKTGSLLKRSIVADLLPALKSGSSFSVFHRFGGTSLSIHHQAGSPAYYPYPLPRTRSYSFSQNVKSTNYISIKYLV